MDGLGLALSEDSLIDISTADSNSVFTGNNSDQKVRIAVVIINYNSSGDLGRCLESLTAYPSAASSRIVIVDNASDDPGLKEVHSSFPDLTWIFSTENLGYSKGCNKGMAQVEADYYLILNPDIVVQPGAVDRLLEYADNNRRAGIIGPQLLNEDGSIQASCRRFYTLRTLLMRRTILGKIFPNSKTVHLHLMSDFDHKSSRPVDWVLGGCILVRHSALDRTGPMDERFFIYFEDVDWCYRTWQAGFEVHYTPDARFMHRHRRSSAQGKFNRTFWMHLGSLISFYEKWGVVAWLLKKWRGPLLVTLLWLFDMIGVSAAFLTAYGLRGLMDYRFSEPLYPFVEYRPLLLFSGLLVSLTFLLTGRYRPGRRKCSIFSVDHLRQVFIVAVMLLASTYLGHLEVVSRVVLLLFIPLLAVFTLAGENFFRRLLNRLERGYLSMERTLLVGTPVQLQQWLQTAGNLTTQGVDIAGYVADPQEKNGGLPALGGGDIPWLGTRTDLLEITRRYRISQVVFWDRPNSSAQMYPLLAGLRSMRVRLRWHVEDVWLLAAGARAEIFGGQLSGVQQPKGATALRVFGDRLFSTIFGLLLAIVSLPFWVWNKSVKKPRGTVSQVAVNAHDLWGYDPQFVMTVDESSSVMPLIWQLPLAGALIKGKLSVWGPRATLDQESTTPTSAADEIDFWRGDPCAPGLVGSWSKGRAGTQGSFLKRILNQLWFNPCGFSSVNQAGQRHKVSDSTTQSIGEE